MVDLEREMKEDVLCQGLMGKTVVNSCILAIEPLRQNERFMTFERARGVDRYQESCDRRSEKAIVQVSA